jgi:prepilin-type N-terminal cleavage/methylation domain-containing protein
MNSKNHKGFTLIEVIFSIMLLGILGTSIFVSQGSILRSISVSHNKVSTCLYMHNALVLFRIQSNYSKKDLPASLQDALGVLKVKKDPTNKEKFTGQKLCNLIITQEKTHVAYANEQQFSYFYYDTTPKDEKNGAT